MSIYELARELLVANRRDREKAIAALAKKIKAEPQYLDEIVSIAARAAVNNVVSSSREQAFRNAQSPTARAAKTAHDIGAAVSLLDWYDIGGKPLRLATADDLRKHIGILKGQAQTLTMQAKFLTRVLEGMKKGKTAGDSYREDEIERLARDYKLPAAA